MSLHKLSAGSGYTYLTRQVAAGDVTARGRGSLGAYYAERRVPRRLARDRAHVPGGRLAGEPVTEAQMVALFGHGHHPHADVLRTEAAGGRSGNAPGSVALGTSFVTDGSRVLGGCRRSALACPDSVSGLVCTSLRRVGGAHPPGPGPRGVRHRRACGGLDLGQWPSAHRSPKPASVPSSSLPTSWRTCSNIWRTSPGRSEPRWSSSGPKGAPLGNCNCNRVVWRPACKAVGIVAGTHLHDRR